MVNWNDEILVSNVFMFCNKTVMLYRPYSKFCIIAILFCEVNIFIIEFVSYGR